jgi:hypothetical protein
MEAPEPGGIGLLTPEIQNLKEESNYIVNVKNKSYNLCLQNYDIFINIYCFYMKDENKHEYEKRYSLEELKNNKYLAICDSIDELYTQLKLEFNKNITSIQESNDSIKIIIPINHIKIKDITFHLPTKIKTEKEKYEDLKEEVSLLRKENKSLKASIEQLENENKKINNKLINLENDNKILFEKIKNIEDKMKINNISKNDNDNANYINNTIILKESLDKQKTLINWIKQKTGKNEISFELLFRKSQNGENSTDFHRYCDNKGPTLSLIQTDKNFIIGGFTPLSFYNDEGGKKVYDSSNQTFIFSLNSMKKYDLIDPNINYAIYNYSGYGPNFGNGNIRLNDNVNYGDSFSYGHCSFINDGSKELLVDNHF